MPSIRNLTIPLASSLLIAVAIGGGCALRESQAPYATKAVEPVADSVSPNRNFAPSEAVYENTAVTAWHTQFPLKPKADTPTIQRPFVEPALFLANTFILPVTALVTEPLNEQTAYRPMTVAPGVTAAVPLDETVDASEYGAYRPNFKPGTTTDLYGHAPATLPSQYGKPQWMNSPQAAPEAAPEEVPAPSTQPVLLP